MFFLRESNLRCHGIYSFEMNRGMFVMVSIILLQFVHWLIFEALEISIKHIYGCVRDLVRPGTRNNSNLN